jgi:uncharacterized protein (DUF1800 family)
MAQLHPRFRWVFPVLTGLLLVSPGASARAQEGIPADRDEIVHVLNRITFGPRPGDVEAVEKIGLHNFIEQQLHPETIDDSATDEALAGFDLLQMSPQQLSDIFDNERKKAQERQKLLAAAAAANGQGQIDPNTAQPPPPPQPGLAGKLAGQAAKANEVRSAVAVAQLEQAKLVRAIDSNRQLQEVLVDFWGNHFNIDVKKGPDRVLKVVDDRDVIRPHIWGSFHDLLEASAKSPAMLFYLDNATNTVGHNVTPREQMLTERIHDQMMENGNAALAPPVPQVGTKKGGINENYAREIMELHTLGVDGGYTQQDVQEVARCFTGWSFDRQTGSFVFRPRQHDNGAKVVLGHQIPAGGGQQDGEMVLDILCSNPATAHRISLLLCERFVSDTPPPALVDRVAGVFTQTGGNLRKVTEAILTSPEFLSPANYNNKIKSPLEFAVSAVRASGSTITPLPPAPYDRIREAMEGGAILGRGAAADRLAKLPRQSLNWHIYDLGEPLFACTPPTGYSEVSKFWVSPGALIERLNFAMALTQQKLSDVRFDSQNILGGIDVDKPDAVLNQCVSVLLQNNISDTTRKVLEQSALPAANESKTVDPSKLIALMIGSPEFQRK